MRALTVLDEAECRVLLGTRTVGRVAMNRRGAGPLVVPVTYALDATGSVVFRTTAGSRLASLVRGPVTFEVDDVDDETRTGWSVLVEGWAHGLDDEDDHDGTAASLRPWPPGVLTHAIRIARGTVSGRRLHETDTRAEV